MSQNSVVVANRVQCMIYAKAQPVISNALRLKVAQRSINILRKMSEKPVNILRRLSEDPIHILSGMD